MEFAQRQAEFYKMEMEHIKNDLSKELIEGECQGGIREWIDLVYDKLKTHKDYLHYKEKYESCKEKILANQKEYYNRNKDKIIDRQKHYNTTHRDEILAKKNFVQNVILIRDHIRRLIWNA